MSEEWENLSFIDHYLLHNKKYESPTSFWRWSAVGTIASVLRDSVYRRMGDNKLFPNVYILSLAESSFHRKGRPIEFAESLVREVRNVKIISGRASIQGIVMELAKTETDRTTGKIIKGGSAVFYAPELAAGIVGDPAAISILTDIYDCKPNGYDTILKTQAKSSVTNLVFSMLAASNEELLKSVYDGSALRGGLLARTFLVVPDEFRPPNSLLDISEEDYAKIDASKKALVVKLKKIAGLAGEVFLSKAAQKQYDAWYNPFRKNHEHNKDKSGMLGRIHTNILKLAIILACNDNQLIIEAKHIETAIDWATALVPNYNKLSMSSGPGTVKEVGGLIINDLLESKESKISRKAVFQRHMLEFDPTIFDTTVLTLETAGMIKTLYDEKQDQWLMLTDKAKEILGAS